MSFGFVAIDHGLDQVLKKAQLNNIVVFAAVSNFGSHQQVAWPAQDQERAICMHSSNDLGTMPLAFTPKADPKTTNFMAISKNICLHWPMSKGGCFCTISGTSTATPVAMPIAALLLAYTEQSVYKRKRKEVKEEIGLVST